MIKLHNVNLEYSEGARALVDINLEIKRGEMVFLVGASGAGKSSLIKSILREVNVDSGRVIVDNQDITRLHRREIPALRRKIGVVFQDFRLLPRKTVFENVAYAMEITGASNKLIKNNVPIALRLVGLEDKADYYPGKLSGGEAQRVSIARSMVNNPKILIADEPTGNLDPKTSKEIIRILQVLNARGTTVLVITHDYYVLEMNKQRVIEMAEGRIIRDERRGGTPNV
ncbi:MAG: cell division ATP-binding protein FtsE [Bacillota bacterium]|nr:cell division ATP-binding protein FtsE [Bacillota bacterium]